MTTFESVLKRHAWRPIPNCPGRFVLKKTTTPPLEIAAIEGVSERYEAAPGKDPVVAVRFSDGGGLISYEHADGFVHTLNTPEGFARKLESLDPGQARKDGG
jgi:hypothetical protein